MMREAHDEDGNRVLLIIACDRCNKTAAKITVNGKDVCLGCASAEEREVRKRVKQTLRKIN